MTTYKITKTFTAGALQGMTITERTTVAWKVGQVVKKPIGGGAYRIDAVEVIPSVRDVRYKGFAIPADR